VVIPTSSSAEQFTLAAQALLRNFLGSLGVPPDSEFARSLQSVGVDSAKFAALQGRYLQLHAALWQSALTREAGRDATPIAPPDRGDRRFSSAEWQRIPWFDYLRQSYLINSRFLSDWIEALEAEPRAKERLRFIARQFSDAMSPANFAATNPEALRLALETKGESLTQGIRQLLEDVHKGRISTTDESVFEVGKNLAVTEGAVVFENELIQLIQYKPVTPTVFKQPLVMFPPCINKYYILDLQPENSLVRYAVEQGHPVFMVSWRNITEELGHLTWDDYVEIGVLKALEVARAICAAEKVNALGFCVGGTMLGAGLAVMAARGDNRVESATFLASMLDFADTGEIGLFIDESSAAVREAAIGKGGIMPGRSRARVLGASRERPRLVIRGQQLSERQIARSFRSALLERGFHQSSRTNVLLVRAQHLSREPPARAGKDDGSGSAGGSRADHRSGLCARHARGPHRALAHSLSHDPAARRRDALRARSERARRRDHQSRLKKQAQPLDRRKAGCGPRSVARRRK